MAEARHALNLRARATRAVAAVLGGRALDAALDEDRVRHGRHPLVEELAIGTIRHTPRLLALAAPLLKRPFRKADQDLQALILVGLYQARFMATPIPVAVSEAVATTEVLGKPWAKGVVNAVLRAAAAKNDASTRDDPNHPEWLVARLKAAWPDTWRAILAANDERAPLTLRVDTERVTRTEYLQRLALGGVSAHAHPLVETAVILAHGAQVLELPGFKEGLVTVQDAAAQLAAPLLAACAGDAVLDACAAPGGKTGHIAQSAPQAHVTAVDYDPARVARLRQTVERLGCDARVRVLTQDLTTDPLADRFQRILIDAPCSATGVIRRHPDIKLHRRASDLTPLRLAQARLLDRLWQNLAPGGTMVYATCSVLPEENEEQILAFLERTPDAREDPWSFGAGRRARTGWQFLPGESGMDGFYYARLVRRA
ncbi:MAG: 16S rRNA (cytosine(967)-C(5))-methyltransferase RsmB [Acidiferrobacter sp.]